MEVLPMNKSRPVATETVKYLDYTKNILQTIPNNDTMEVVTQTNAVKSPTDSLKATTLVYTVEEIARMLAISLRSASRQKSCSCGQPQEVHAGAHHLDGRGDAGGSGQHGGPHPASGSPPHAGGCTARGRDRRADPRRS